MNPLELEKKVIELRNMERDETYAIWSEDLKKRAATAGVEIKETELENLKQDSPLQSELLEARVRLAETQGKDAAYNLAEKEKLMAEFGFTPEILASRSAAEREEAGRNIQAALENSQGSLTLRQFSKILGENFHPDLLSGLTSTLVSGARVSAAQGMEGSWKSLMDNIKDRTGLLKLVQDNARIAMAEGDVDEKKIAMENLVDVSDKLLSAESDMVAAREAFSVARKSGRMEASDPRWAEFKSHVQRQLDERRTVQGIPLSEGEIRTQESPQGWFDAWEKEKMAPTMGQAYGYIPGGPRVTWPQQNLQGALPNFPAGQTLARPAQLGDPELNFFYPK